jgi:hypothetical protein
MSADEKISEPMPLSQPMKECLTFLHQARGVRDLHPAQVARIERRLQGTNPRLLRISRWPAWIVLALVCAGAGFAVAQVDFRSLPILGALFRPKTGATTPGPQPAPKSLGHKAAPSTGRSEPEQPQSPALPSVGPENPGRPEPPTQERPKAPPPGKTVDVPSQPPPSRPVDNGLPSELQPAPVEPMPVAKAGPPGHPIVLESRSFAEVIGHWHHVRDPHAALALLDDHERRYPDGAMRVETRILRAELVLAQGRPWAALAVLDGLSLAGTPRERELVTLRGELRVKAGRCKDARQDLSAVLEKNRDDDLGRRAAQALSRCPM